MEAFLPDWVLVSCGFDAHRADPLGNLELSSGDFAELARVVSEFVPLSRPPGLVSRGRLRPGVPCVVGRGDTRGTPGQARAVAAPTSGGPGLSQLRTDRTTRLACARRLTQQRPSGRRPTRAHGRGSAAVDQHRAPPVGGAVLACRAEQHPDDRRGRLPTTRSSAPFDASTKIGAGCPLTTRASMRRPGCSAHLRQRLLQRRGDVGLGIEVVGQRDRPAVTRGHSQVRTTSSTVPVIVAWRAAQERASSDEGDPSMPTTILPLFGDSGVVISGSSHRRPAAGAPVARAARRTKSRRAYVAVVRIPVGQAERRGARSGCCAPSDESPGTSRKPTPELENGDRGGWPPFSKHRFLGRGGCPKHSGDAPVGG